MGTRSRWPGSLSRRPILKGERGRDDPSGRELCFVRGVLSLCVAVLFHASLSSATAADSARPNLVFILADDLGCYSAKLVSTPNLDRLAAKGMRVTDAHTPSAVCTPTRRTDTARPSPRVRAMPVQGPPKTGLCWSPDRSPSA